MKPSGARRLLYILFAFLTLLYTFFGLVINFNAGSGLSKSNAAFEASYQIGTDSMSLGLFIILTGIPLFVLFLFLYSRASRDYPTQE